MRHIRDTAEAVVGSGCYGEAVITSPPDDDAGLPTAQGAPAGESESASGGPRPAAKRPAGRHPAVDRSGSKRPAPRTPEVGERRDGPVPGPPAIKAAAPRPPAIPRKPAEPGKAAQPRKPAEPRRPAQHRRPAEPRTPAEPRKAGQSRKAGEPRKAAAPGRPVEARKPGEPRKQGEPRKPTAPQQPVTGGPHAGTKTSAARNAAGRTAVPEPIKPAAAAVVMVEPAVEADVVEPAVVQSPGQPEVVEPVASVASAEAARPEPPIELVQVANEPDAESASPAAAEKPPARPPLPEPVLPPNLIIPPRPAPPAALRLHGVSRSFGGTTAVAGLDLTVPSGSFYGLVGPNGAGKTTTLSMIAGLLRPDRGRIEIAGMDLAKHPRAAKALMGVLPDRLRTFDRLTGRQLLYYFGVLRGLKPDVVDRRTADLARAFDLTDALGRVVSDYSAGMTKKVMLAGALIHRPRLLVLDEPFEAVDPVSSAKILEILKAYVAHGGTVVLSSHGMDLIERVCTRVAVMVAGQLLAEGTVDEVKGELTLEQRFVELSGEAGTVEGLEWLHTFSG